MPKKEPIKTNGVEQNNHKNNKEIKAENLIASPSSKIKKKLEKKILNI